MNKPVPSPIAGPSRARRLRWICETTTFSPATVWRRVRDDPSFPKPFSLSDGVTVWDEAEIIAWLQAKKSQRSAA